MESEGGELQRLYSVLVRKIKDKKTKDKKSGKTVSPNSLLYLIRSLFTPFHLERNAKTSNWRCRNRKTSEVNNVKIILKIIIAFTIIIRQ